MQYTCQRCGLQRDDRRGSGCNGIKGQAHDWVETDEYEKQQRQKELENWINSEDSLEWKKEYENIKIFFKEETINIQKKYTPLLERNKENYVKLFEEANKKYNIIVEYYKKLLENREIIIEETVNEIGKKGILYIFIFLIIMIISFIIMNIITNVFFSILAVIIIFILGIKINFNKSINKSIQNKYLKQALDAFAENYFNKFNDNEKKETLDFINELEYELDYYLINKDDLEEELKKIEKAWKTYIYNMEKEKDSYLKKIVIDYREDIKNTLQKGIQMMQENNEKYGVDEDYYYDNFYFNFEPIDLIKYPNLYNDDIRKFREKYIRDSDFFKNYK